MIFHITIDAEVRPEHEMRALELGLDSIIEAWEADVDEMLSYNSEVFTFTREVRLGE